MYSFRPIDRNAVGGVDLMFVTKIKGHRSGWRMCTFRRIDINIVRSVDWGIKIRGHRAGW
jgi:hypothetical protein